MTQSTTAPKVSERTAHLFNALRLLEEINEEIYNAFSHLGEDEAAGRLECFESQYNYTRDTLKDWIAEAAHAWATSAPTPAEF